jgi:uncharacterized integral membrane protein (TIGR00698 family)
MPQLSSREFSAAIQKGLSQPITLRFTPQQAIYWGLAGLTPWLTSPIALALGMGLAVSIQNPFPQFSRWLARLLLQVCVVLLGFGINLAALLQLGQQSLLFSTLSIVGTMLLGHWLGICLKVPAKTAILISVGTAICGGSAIAAMAAVIGAVEQEVSLAMGTIFLLNALALYLFPWIGHFLQLSPEQFGLWAGIAIHDTSSVVGAATEFGLAALTTATTVKLSRALWILPITLGFALWNDYQQRRQSSQVQAQTLSIPWFIGCFLLASVLRSLLPGLAEWSPVFTQVSRTGLQLTLFLIGAGLSAQTLKTVGWQPMLQGVLLWVMISLSTVAMILGKLA